MIVADAVATRRSIRAFADKPVPTEIIRRVLEQARWAPSGSNFQPWEAVVLAGEPLKTLRDLLLASERDDPVEYDFHAPMKIEKYASRMQAMGAALYGILNIAREDRAQRNAFFTENLLAFNAPVLLLCYFPKTMKEAQWSDVGMWLQTIMLLLRGEGLDSCSEETFGLYGRTIKKHLGLSDDMMLFCGMAIGYGDHQAPINNFQRERIPLNEQVTFLGL